MRGVRSDGRCPCGSERRRGGNACLACHAEHVRQHRRRKAREVEALRRRVAELEKILQLPIAR